MNSNLNRYNSGFLAKWFLGYIMMIILFFGVNSTSAQSVNNQIIVGERFTIESKILNEKRTYSVYLPASYKNRPEQKYIVAYVLDGERNKFLEVSGIAQSMHSVQDLKLQIPELIIVSIENIDRTRDFTPTNSMNYLDREDIAAFKTSGGAANFMAFIEQELMPAINSKYRTHEQDLIIGHSAGGLFALHCLLENPELFTYYLIIDPSWFWDHNYIGKRGKEVLQQKTDLKARVFIGLANNLKDDKRHYQWGEEFFDLLEKNPSPYLWEAFRYFEDEKHLTVPIPATYYGLRYLFQPYEIDLNEVTENPSVLEEYSKKTSEELLLEIKPDEWFVNRIGYVALYDRQIPDAAISIFELNTRNFPNSLNVWDSLADAYIVKGYYDKAKSCYERILELSPTNSNAKKKLEELESK